MVVTTTDPDDVQQALGRVVDEERGSLPYALIHGESLVACASWALGDAGVTPVDYATTWTGIQAAGEPFVVHDALCPMTPAEFIASCVARAVDRDVVVVGALPAVDSATPTSVASPVVLPGSVVAALDGLPSLDFAELVAALRERFATELVEAPPAARRVTSTDDVRDLEELTTPEPT